MSELLVGFVATAELEHTKAADVIKAADVVAVDEEKDE